jgi:DNA polymerase III epsilon subunit-like protein
MTDWTALRYAVVDVEGNGQQPPDLVELAIVPIVGGVIGEPVSWLIKPPRAVKYRQATEWLTAAGFDVLKVDVNQKPPEQAAAFICDRLTTFLAAGSG